jgi:phosphatidylglycerophosphate synthase
MSPKHQAKKVADWELVPAEDRSPLQDLAHFTDGWVTPGNIVSAAGAGLTLKGLREISNDHLGRGALLISVGRALDVADGVVAHETRTKGPKGEAIDASIDKALMAASVVSLVRKGLLPKSFAGGLAVVHGGSAAASVVARKKVLELHPSKEGKYGTFLQWGAIIAGLSAAFLERRGSDKTEAGIRQAEKILAVGGITLGAIALAKYGARALGRSQETQVD